MNIVVTGGSAGVGRATVRRVAQRWPGAGVGILARGLPGLEAAATEVRALNGRPLVLQTDVSDADAVDAAATRAEDELGPIDIWINNAMTSVLAPVADTTPEEFRRVTEVTYLGVVHGTMAALSRMSARGTGTIVQVGSALAYRGIPLQAAYCGAKHAIQGFTESLRAELLHDKSGVRITMVQLPALNTPQFDVVRSKVGGRPKPLGTIFQPEVAAAAIVWAAEHAPRELDVGGPTVAALLANKVAPGLFDRYLSRTAVEGQTDPDDGRPDAVPGDNLFEPVQVDLGAHGRFDDDAHETSWQLLLRTAGGAAPAAPPEAYVESP